MSFEPMIEPQEYVMVLQTAEGGRRSPRPLEGVLLGEDPGGVLVAPIAPAPAEVGAGEAGSSPLERGVYVPFHSIETILLLGRRTMRELRRAAVEETAHRQRVLDELDRIFFDMVERKGRYSRTSRLEDPEEPRSTPGAPGGHSSPA